MTNAFRRGFASATDFSARRLLFGAAALTLASLPGGQAYAQAVSGGTLRVALSLLPECLDPQQDGYSYDKSGPGRQLVDSLTFVSAASAGKLEPWLATSWTVDEQAQVYTFTLRDDVTFSNGEKLTAQVVADNYNWLATRPRTLGGAASFEAFDGAEAIDDRTVRIKFSAPRADFLFRTAIGYLGIVAPETLKRTAEQRCAEGVVGSGPFIPDGALNFNRSVTFKRRDDYAWAPASIDHGGPAYLEKIEWQVIPEGSVRTGVLRTGQVDYIQAVSTKDVSAVAGEGFATPQDQTDSLSVGFFANTSRPNLSDVRVRQAIQVALDRKKIIDYAFDGVGVPATSVVATGSPLYNDLSPLLAQDQDKARKLLDEAGWVLPEGGRVRAKDGQPLVIEVTFRENAYNIATTEALQQQLAEVGIEIALKPRTGADFGAAVSAKNYELHRWGGELWPPRMLSIKTANEAVLGEEEGAVLETLFDQNARTSDLEKSRGIARQWETIILEKGYFFPVLEVPFPVNAHRPELQGLDSSKALGTNGSTYFYAAWLKQ